MPVAGWRRWSFGVGLGLVALALFSPLDAWGEQQFFFVHMAQHVLLGELAPLAIVAGLTGPLLRPLLAYNWIHRLRVLAHPMVAWPLWAVNLYLWHLPFFYEAALGNEVRACDRAHLVLHRGRALLGPGARAAPAPRWFGSGAKLLYIVAARFTSMVLANVLAWADDPIYGDYVHAVARFGISARADQGIAGSVMMIVDSVVTIAAIAWLFLKLAGESERRQELIEQGVEPEAAASRRPLRPRLTARRVPARNGASPGAGPRGSGSG